MNPHNQKHDEVASEVARLAHLALSGNLDAPNVERLRELIVHSPLARDSYWSFMVDSIALRELSAGATRDNPDRSGCKLDRGEHMVAKRSMPVGYLPDLSASDHPLVSGSVAPPDPPLPDAPAVGFIGRSLDSLFDRLGFPTPVALPRFVAAAAIFGLICFSLGFGVFRAAYSAREKTTSLPVSAGQSNQPTAVSQAAGSRGAELHPYTATLVNVTNCRWDRSGDMAPATLHPGQSLHLLEGIAKVMSTLPNGGSAEFQLEGPLAMMLTAEGMPSLLFGKLSGNFACDLDRFALDTPLGRVTVLGEASIGITAAANEIELHVFSGGALFESWTRGVDHESEHLQAAAGDCICATVTSSGQLSIDRSVAQPSRFVSPAAMAASQLHITPQYVSAILKSEPIGYWRFESDRNRTVRNEVADNLHCKIVGDSVRLKGDGANHIAEFGETSGPGYLMTDDTIGSQVAENYSLELWVKPAYHHHASLFSLLEWSPGEDPVHRHRFQVELCPPAVTAKNVRDYERHGGRVRFYHLRQSCFSGEPYSVRQWQHLAAVKEGPNKRLYVNGRLAATDTDKRSLGPNTRILIGQCFPLNPHLKEEVSARLLVGELDEIAFYNRPLGQHEIKEHYRLARPHTAH